MSIREDITTMNPIDKLHLIDELLISLDIPNHSIDQIWENEAEERIQAYDNQNTTSVSLEEVLDKYKYAN